MLNESAQADAVGHGRPAEGIPAIDGGEDVKVYIALGTIALKRGKTKGVRAGAGLAALATLAYIAAVAITRQPAIAFQLLGLGG